MTGPQTPRSQNAANGLTGLSSLFLICLRGLGDVPTLSTSKQALGQMLIVALPPLTCQHLLVLIPLSSPEPPHSSNPRALRLARRPPMQWALTLPPSSACSYGPSPSSLSSEDSVYSSPAPLPHKAAPGLLKQTVNSGGRKTHCNSAFAAVRSLRAGVFRANPRSHSPPVP